MYFLPLSIIFTQASLSMYKVNQDCCQVIFKANLLQHVLTHFWKKRKLQKSLLTKGNKKFPK